MDAIGPLGWRKFVPDSPVVTSDRLGWMGLEAARFRASPGRFRASPGGEVCHPALTHHMLVLFTAPPKELELRYEGVTRGVPPPANSIFLVPAGSPVRVRTRDAKDQLHIFLAPEMVARVAAEEFDLDSAGLSVCPLDGVDLPHLRATMQAVEAEMRLVSVAGGWPPSRWPTSWLCS